MKTVRLNGIKISEGEEELKREEFLELRETIRKKRESPGELWKYEIGERREQKMAAVLQEMKNEGLIRDFLPTDVFSFQNIVEGFDFFVVHIDSTYKICPLSVTGEGWVEEHKRKHPEIPVISITENDTTVSIKNKIMEAIKNKGS